MTSLSTTKFLVYAGNVNQHMHLCRNLGIRPSQVPYIQSVDSMRGRDRDTPVVLFGTYYARSDHDEFIDYCSAFGHPVFHIDDDGVMTKGL